MSVTSVTKCAKKNIILENWQSLMQAAIDSFQVKVQDTVILKLHGHMLISLRHTRHFLKTKLRVSLSIHEKFQGIENFLLPGSKNQDVKISCMIQRFSSLPQIP